MFLLDTNVVSELRKIRSGRADANVARWVENAETILLHISAITVQELEIGVLLAERKDAAQGRILRKWLDCQVLPAFAGRILPVDEVVARKSAQLHCPNPAPFRDSLIAATAFAHGMTLVTRNVADFEKSGVRLINPWQEQKRRLHSVERKGLDRP